MELVTTSGASYTAVVEHHKGHWKNLMTDSQVEAKFRKLATGVLNAGQTDRLLETLWRLVDLKDAGDVVRLTQAI